MFIPSMLLKRLYTYSSLKNNPDTVQFAIKNRLSDARLTRIHQISVDKKSVPLTDIVLDTGAGELLSPAQISPDNPVDFPLRQNLVIFLKIPALTVGIHKVEISFQVDPFGDLKFDIEDSISEVEEEGFVRIPRSNQDDYSQEIVQERQKFVEKISGIQLSHIIILLF